MDLSIKAGKRSYPFLLVTTSLLLLFFTGLSTLAHDDSMPGQGRTPLHARENMRAFAQEHHHNENLPAQSITICSGGLAGTYPCSNVDLMAFLPLAQIGGGSGNDIWGWTDSLTGKEYAIMGLSNGTAFVDISDPVNPVYLGHLPRHTGVGTSSWRDIKTYNDHAFIGSEALNSGTQVVDLTDLRSIANPPVTMVETAFYTGFSTSHNIVINEDSGFAYGVGVNSGNCARGLHFVDILTPTNPLAAGCFSSDGYTGVSTTIDHNQYIVGDYSYQANYQSGLRVIDISDIGNGNLSEAGFFDIYTSGNATNFNGAWSVYPFFASGNVVVSGIEQGLYILRPNLGTPNNPPVVDLLDPANGSGVSGTVQIRIAATDTEDADGTLNVEWNVDSGTWQPTSYSSPDYLASWVSTSVLDGALTLNARAVDSSLQAHTDSHSITTANGTPKFTVDVINVSIQIGKGKRNRGFGTVLVSDEGGAPLGGALVDTSFSGDWTGGFSSTSGSDGQFTVQTQKVKNLAYVQLCIDQASKAGWEWDIDGSTLCKDSNGSGSAFGSVSGSVTNAASDGRISNAAVSTDTGQSTNTDAFGDYLLSNVPVGTRTVSVTASGFDSQNDTATVNESANSIVDFALNESANGGSGSIKGTVYSGAGGKLNGVTVRVLGGSSSNTNKGGKYTIQNVPAGSQAVEASKDGYMRQQQNVTVNAGGSITVNFTLSPN